MDKQGSRFRLYQYQEACEILEIEVGDWVVQRKNDHGHWRNWAGPFKYEDAAKGHLARYQRQEATPCAQQ